MSSVAKVFRILETVVSHQERGLAYSEVVSRTQLPKATAHRVLKSLVETGYLRFDVESGRYFGDLRLAALGSTVTSHFDLTPYARPYLLRLQEETAHTCHLGVRDGQVGVYLDKIESATAFGIKLYSAIGKSFPLHCTGMGKVLLATMSPEETRRILSRKLQAFTPNTLTDPLRLSRELAAVRRLGYAVDREEITRGMMCVAAPVRDHEKQTVAAISATFPASIARDRGIQREVRAVTRCAAAITAALQGSQGRIENGRRSETRQAARQAQRR